MNNISLDYIFISYSHKDGIGKISEYLNDRGYNFIYDSEISVGSSWSNRARRYISNQKCLGVAVLLSRNSMSRETILTELGIAKLNGKPIMPVIIGADSLNELHERTKQLSTDEEDAYIIDEIFNFFKSETIFITEKQLYSGEYQEKIDKTFASWGLKPIPKTEFIHSTYKSDYSNESPRLQQQRAMFCETDKKAFKIAIDNTASETFYILDVAGNDGGLIMQRIEDIHDKKIVCIGIDIDLNAVERANTKYGDTGKYFSYCLDCVSENFEEEMTSIMKKHDIPAFDFVVCSFALLHIDDPFHCLTNVRKLMRRGSYIFIRDMDDGLSISFPDPKKLVETFETFSTKLSFTGKRDTGRSVPNMLTRASFRDIQVITEEINTLNKDADYLDMLFNVNFRFILVGLEQSYEADKDNTQAANNYKWGKKAFRELEDLFHEPGYYYRMGTMVFLARR